MVDKSAQKVLWSASYGIASNRQIPLFFSSDEPLVTIVKRIRSSAKPCESDIVLGWGTKPNTQDAIAFATNNHLKYIRLEDGFISYLGHPSADHKRLSLIKDDEGIYYDARQTSRLEQLCLKLGHSNNLDKGLFSAEDEVRAQRLIKQLTANGISKYNQPRVNLPNVLKHLGDDCILLIDQTAGDQSIEAGLATAESFQTMLNTAIKAHPSKSIIVKTHPDVLIAGKKGKQGHFHKIHMPDNVYLLTEDCLIPELMAKVTDVYTVTSQLGFEALLYGKRVHCFGMPFYAGWGLTHDQMIQPRRTSALTLPQLVYASLIQYPTYLSPETQQVCEVEEIVGWLSLQLGGQGRERTAVDVCYAFGFSLWKRAFVKQFVGRMADKVIFINDEKKLEALLSQTQLSQAQLSQAHLSSNQLGNPPHTTNKSNHRYSVLLWGRGRVAWANDLRKLAAVWFMEDGFLRSVGLGADLRRPSSLVIDHQGMYYDSSESSDILDLLNTIDINAEQNDRASALIDIIQRQFITKYNVGCTQSRQALVEQLQAQANGREIVVVPGQFENDLSIACSLGPIKKNSELLAQVRIDYPNAFIIFKEHPDVYSGVRPGALGQKAAMENADLYLSDINMASLLVCADRVCTLTSLAGYEALLRHKKVTVYGSPFYAGWGLTTDQIALPDRHKTLSLNELVYGAMVQYSRYVDWNTGFLTGPEQTVAFLTQQREISGQKGLKSNWLSRQGRKLKYFIDSYFF